MRQLMAIAFACAAMIGVTTASSGAAAGGGQPAVQAAPPADRCDADDASQPAPACVQAAECTAYCAGGTPLCVAKHCSCAS
jgi:hypothetical protein